MRYLYKITNKINGKCYIGQTVNFHNRMVAHKNGRKDRACLVSKAIKKYGIENFIFEKLAILENHMIDETEQKAIKVYNSISPNGYNLDSGGCLNKIQSQQTKEKISKASKGKKRLNVKPISEEHKQRIRECNKGKIRTEENKKKISDSLKSKFTLMTPEEKSLRYGSSKGKSRTEKDKENISKNLKKFYAEHPEAKAKLANNNKGRIWSDETLNRRRNSMNKYYSNMSEEDKEKLSLRKRGKISKNNKSGYIGVCSKKGTGL